MKEYFIRWRSINSHFYTRTSSSTIVRGGTLSSSYDELDRNKQGGAHYDK